MTPPKLAGGEQSPPATFLAPLALPVCCAGSSALSLRASPDRPPRSADQRQPPPISTTRARRNEKAATSLLEPHPRFEGGKRLESSRRAHGPLQNNPPEFRSRSASRSCAWVRDWPATLHSQDNDRTGNRCRAGRATGRTAFGAPSPARARCASRVPASSFQYVPDAAVLLGAALVRRLQERLRAISSNDVIQDAIRREAKRLTIPPVCSKFGVVLRVTGPE
jgi:hypothetical protein